MISKKIVIIIIVYMDHNWFYNPYCVYVSHPPFELVPKVRNSFSLFLDEILNDYPI